MRRKKFKIIDKTTGEKCKLIDGQMIVMNGAGVFFLVSDMHGYYTNVQKLSDRFPTYAVVWTEN